MRVVVLSEINLNRYIPLEKLKYQLHPEDDSL